MQGIRKEDTGLLQLLPVVTMWIKNDTELSEQGIRMLASMHPNEFAFAKKTSVAEMFRMAENYKDNRLYKDLIAVIMSEKGRKWVEKTVALCKNIQL